jgi:hypothetical protein
MIVNTAACNKYSLFPKHRNLLHHEAHGVVSTLWFQASALHTNIRCTFLLPACTSLPLATCLKWTQHTIRFRILEGMIDRSMLCVNTTKLRWKHSKVKKEVTEVQQKGEKGTHHIPKHPTAAQHKRLTKSINEILQADNSPAMTRF